jgi:hypothetical protein
MHKLEDVPRLLNDMIAAKVEPDKGTYVIMLQYYKVPFFCYHLHCD